MKKNQEKHGGFTLIELVVVMALIAILSLIVVAAIQAARRSATETQNRGNARSVETAMEAYSARNNGSFPPNLTNVTIATVLDADAGQLKEFITGWKPGSCSNGGGKVTTNATGSSFTVTVFDHTCADTTNIAAITH